MDQQAKIIVAKIIVVDRKTERPEKIINAKYLRCAKIATDHKELIAPIL